MFGCFSIFKKKQDQLAGCLEKTGIQLPADHSRVPSNTPNNIQDCFFKHKTFNQGRESILIYLRNETSASQMHQTHALSGVKCETDSCKVPFYLWEGLEDGLVVFWGPDRKEPCPRKAAGPSESHGVLSLHMPCVIFQMCKWCLRWGAGGRGENSE